MSKDEELVLCDITHCGKQYMCYLPRGICEEPTGLIAALQPRQVIPYVVVIGDFDGVKKCICYRRAGNEKRLDGKWSIGIGGHVNPQDFDQDRYETIDEAALRELHEEINNNLDILIWDTTHIGSFQLDQTPVDRVHKAEVFIAAERDNYTHLQMTECSEFKWVTLDELDAQEGLEEWSVVTRSLPGVRAALAGDSVDQA